MEKSKKLDKKEEKVEIPGSINLSGDKIRLSIGAKPNSKTNAILEVNEEEIRVSIAAPAKENEANKELICYLAEVLGVKKTDLSLDKGSKSKSKVVVIDKSAISRSEILERLQKQIDS